MPLHLFEMLGFSLRLELVVIGLANSLPFFVAVLLLLLLPFHELLGGVVAIATVG